MKLKFLWLICLYLIFGTGVTCDGNRKNRQTERSPTSRVQNSSELKTTLECPWNVGVYKYNNNDSNNYEMICGGSLIAKNLVVSAAHCFWDERTTTISNGTYKIAVGKYRRDISVRDNEHTQTVDVRRIHMNEYYNGSNGLHAADIAVLVLASDIKVDNTVAPILVDWNNTIVNAIPNGSNGKIVGWGIGEDSRPSPFLLEISLPYINRTTCRDMYTNGFQHFVTDDKFCAGSLLGQKVTEGYSGAGLSFLHNNSRYLIGVVSVSDPWTDNAVVVLTDISYHVRWIAELYAKYT